MKLYDLYKEGVIIFEEYHQRLMAKFDAAINKAEKFLQKMEVKKCTK